MLDFPQELSRLLSAVDAYKFQREDPYEGNRVITLFNRISHANTVELDGSLDEAQTGFFSLHKCCNEEEFNRKKEEVLAAIHRAIRSYDS